MKVYVFEILLSVLLMIDMFLIYCIIRIRHKPNKFHIFLINLSRSKDRLENFKKYHKEMTHKIALTRIEGVDKHNIASTQMIQKWNERISFNPQFKSKEQFDKFKTHTMQTKALQLSNIKCMKLAKKKQVEWTIICEDDAELPKDIDFEAIVKEFSDSKVIYLDNRNKGGNGYTPRCCTSCVLYHHSILDFFIKEFDPERSSELDTFCKTSPFVNGDFYEYWLITKFKVKCSSRPVVPSGRFESLSVEKVRV